MNKLLKFFVIPSIIISTYLAFSWVSSPPKITRIHLNTSLFRTAHNLVTYGVFSHQHYSNIQQITAIKPSRIPSPALPVLVASYAMIDTQFKAALACFYAKGSKCKQPHILYRFFVFQIFFMFLGILAAFYLAYMLSGSWHTALLTLVLFLVSSDLKLGKILSPYVYQYFTIFTALSFILLMHSRKNYLYGLLAGGFLGLAALFQTHFIFGIFIAIPVIIFLLMIDKNWKLHQSLSAGITLIVGVGLVAGSWSLRNYSLFGDFWLNPYESTQNLSDRLTFMNMDFKQSALATLHFLPSYVGQVSDFFLSPDFKHKLGFYFPGSYLNEGRDIFIAVIKEQKNDGLRFITLIQNHIYAAPLQYLQSTVPLFIRSLFAGGSLVCLAGLFFIPRTLKIHSKRQSLTPLLLIFAVMLSFALTSALITPAIFWFGLPIIFIYCYSISYVLGCF